MKFFIVLIMAMLALTGATRVSTGDMQFMSALSQLKGSNRAFESELRAILEVIREIILNGDEENNVPVLDPFEFDELSVSTTIPNTADIDLLVRELAVNGLGGFVVDEITFNILRLRLDFDILLPSIQASVGYYDLLAKIINYNFFGQGSGSVEAVNFRAHGFATVTLQNGYLFMNNFEIKFEMESFKSNLNGLLGGGEVSDVINEIIQVLVPALIESQGDTISETVAAFVVDFANQYLTQLTLGDLIDIITGGGGGSGRVAAVPLQQI